MNIKTVHPGLASQTTKVTLREATKNMYENTVTVDFKRPSDIASKFTSLFYRNLIVTTPSFTQTYANNISEVEVIVTDKATNSTLTSYSVVLNDASYKDDRKFIQATNITPGYYVAKIAKKDPATNKNVIEEYFTVIVKRGERSHINLTVDTSKKIVEYK